MPAYENKATRGFEKLLEKVIADRPTTITRERESHEDKFRGKTTTVAGPFEKVRIEPFKMSRVYPVFDEKGSTAAAAYILVGLDLPRDVAPGTPTFRLNDTIIDADGNRYRVTGPPRYNGRAVELNIELLG